MSAPVHEDLVGQIRELFDQARAAGQPLPGRPTLAKLTGATEHRVRLAVAELTADEEATGDQPASRGAENRQDGATPVTSTASVSGTERGHDHQPPADPALAAHFAVVPDGSRATVGTLAAEAGDAATSPVSVAASAAVSGAAAAALSGTAAGAKVVSWAGFVFGSVMSVAANVLHTWLPAERMPPGWAPGIAAQIGSAVWPIGLLLSVEVLSRVRWPAGFGWRVARFGGTGTVALGSAVISYGHVHDLLLAWGYTTVAAYVGPLVLDGLMVISGFALLAMSGSASVASAGDSPIRDGRDR
ncbi:hypothetical protein [Amycolatopsis sp. cmx-4-68]|uniref:hypothetical protein n=1 Tax=Amycolatopsis sp. cmx-4-68 TaxID=2790938 RepID=UPI0039799965